ncbi:MAG: co-chaperone YbbN, partial [Actinobacteria bacterium]|nr:co-chaperone YbbN [Actinomycetota bacterium]
MSDFMSRANLSGAVDLSSLRKPEPSAQVAGANAAASQSVNVPDLCAIGTEANLKNFIAISNSVPVLIDFFATDLEVSTKLSEKLERLVRALAGRMFLLKVDTQASLQVAQAFGVKEVPSVVALVKGQPIPLFEGDQTQETIQTVLDRLLQVAAENGVSGNLQVSAEFSEPQIAELPAKHKAAFDAIDSGNYAEAVKQYEAAINENPADAMAIAGLAQAKLLLRTDGLDFEKALALAPNDFDSAITKADACVAV